MRRLVCFVLVLAFVLSMACVAFAAATPSAGDSGTPSGGSGSGTGSTISNTGNPKTGDMIMMWAMLMVLAVVALAAVTMMYRKFM